MLPKHFFQFPLGLTIVTWQIEKKNLCKILWGEQIAWCATLKSHIIFNFPSTKQKLMGLNRASGNLGGRPVRFMRREWFLFLLFSCLSIYRKDYTKERKNLKYIKFFQRIKFMGKSWYQQTQTVNCLRLSLFSPYHYRYWWVCNRGA